MNKLIKTVEDYKLFARSKFNITSTALDDYDKYYSAKMAYIEPVIVEESHNNLMSISVFSKLFTERILFLGSEIDEMVANVLVSQLMYLETTSKSDIQLYINSPGGSVSAGMAIYDTMNYIKPDVATFCIGMAASMGSFLLSSGAKGKRNSLKHSNIMIHQPLGGSNGMEQASDISIRAKQIEAIKNMLFTILAKNTGKTYEEIERDADRDRWFTPQEALDYGLIDNILERK